MMDEQFSLFSDEEIPDVNFTVEVPRETVVHYMKPWINANGVTKKASQNAVTVAHAFINENKVAPTILETVFGRDGFLLSAKKPTDQEVIDALNVAPYYHEAETLLHKWSDRRSLSLKSIKTSILVLARALSQDKYDVADIKYALQHRGLLASAKVLTPESIDSAIAGVAGDREAGKLCNEIFHRWYGQYYEGRYTQPIGQILQVVKKALTSGMNPSIVERALILTGAEGVPVTETSLQYGMVKARKEEELKERAGAFADQIGTQRDIVARLFSQSDKKITAEDYEGMF